MSPKRTSRASVRTKGVPIRFLTPLVLSLVACIDGPTRATGTIPLPSVHRAELDATAPPAESDSNTPDVGAGLSASLAQPGHYAADVRYHQESACSQSWDSYHAHGSLVLDLGADGRATACRGKHMTEVGPDYRMEMMEQQGFRGTWRRDGAWMDVTLALDDSTCTQRRGYTNREPTPWHLRCVALTPEANGGSPITLPVLGCQFVTAVYAEALGYQVEGVLAEGWVLLGAGAGVRVDLEQGALMAQLEDRFVLARPTTPITNDAWTAN